MSDSPLNRTFHEIRALARTPVLWAGLGILSLLLGLAGPFDTYDALPLLPRLVYWAGVTGLSYFSGWFVSSYVIKRFEACQWPLWREAALAGLCVGVVISAQIIVLNWVVFGLSPARTAYFWGMIANTLVISFIVTGSIIWANRRGSRTAAPATPEPAGPPRVVQRLALEKRGALVSLSVQDHYVEIVTTQGRDLVLMRLADAIAETEGCTGLQVHRSHWVALDHIAAARREGARGVLTLADGREIPVSRTYVPSLRDAGLL